jgi:hypothetical protein
MHIMLLYGSLWAHHRRRLPALCQTQIDLMQANMLLCHEHRRIVGHCFPERVGAPASLQVVNHQIVRAWAKIGLVSLGLAVNGARYVYKCGPRINLFESLVYIGLGGSNW